MAKKKKRKIKAQKAEKNLKKAKKAVLYFLGKTPGRAFNHKQIAAGADLRGLLSHTALIDLLEELVAHNRIEKSGRGKYKLKQRVFSVIGNLDVAKNGFGFVVVEGDEESQDIFIGPKNMGKALNGDRVRVKITKSAKFGNRPEGEVIEILERSSDQFIGVVKILEGIAFFIPDNQKIHVDFFIPDSKLNGAENGQKVVVKMVDWERRSPEGEVVRVLGNVGDNETEMHAILMQYGFVPEFPDAVEAEAEAISGKITAAEIKKRRDFRKVTTFTIDPPDAKDFDDALSFQKLDNGHVEVGIHIADVSHYVKPGTELDKEAYKRATSVYLVDRTVPMLPEKLSNNVCSLRPNEDRCTFSAVFELDEKGKVYNEWFGRTVIHSDRRFAYLEAQEILDNGEGEYFEELNTLNVIAHALRKQRFDTGSINFEEDEVKFELDEKGKPIRVFRKVRKDTHKMIEDFMLLANRRVAYWVYNQQKDNPPPFVYRVHDRPDEEKLHKIRQFVATLGYDLDLSDESVVAESLNALMTGVEGKPEQGMIQQIAVRAMAKAIYSTNNIGHYGLGFDHYTHFTSPIRRYPDLMVHRLMEKYLTGNLGWDANELALQCKHTSAMERKAVEAERASVKYKQVEYLEDKVGLQFPGIVSGVTSWGIYVELEESRTEGMVRLNDMEDDYYEVDEENYCIVGRSTGNVIHLGDRVMIEVKEANLHTRTIDFILVEILEQPVREQQDAILGEEFNRNSRRKAHHSGKPKGRGRNSRNRR